MSTHPSSPRYQLRWIAAGILLLSLLAHLTLLEWLKGELILPEFDDEADQVIQITLPAAPPILRAPKATVRRPPAPAELPTPTAPPASTSDTNEVPSAPIVAADNAAPPVKEALAEPQEAANTQEEANAQDTQPPLFDKVSLPPAAELGYTFTAVKDGRKLEGYGNISWKPDGAQYVISGEAGVLFFSVLSYKSMGSVDGFGIAPELYVEKRFTKPETNTHFHRERKQITFSASTNSYPLKGGEQDQASMIWQIASLGRGDSAKFVPGLAFELFVAGTRKAADWRVYVNGKETIEIASGSTEAWHLTLIPTERNFEQQFEVWLAPDKEWYPVRLHYAGNGNSFLDMRLSKIDSKK
jgi:hypothetical protein